MPAYQFGGLYVVERASPRSAILRALKQIDDRLFLERQISIDDRPVWCVVCNVGGDRPPVTILEYRDDNGDPIPEPADSLLYRVAQMPRSSQQLNEQILRANEKLKADRAERAREETAELTRDIVPRVVQTRSVVFPRGVYLRQARDRKRAKGWKV
jgi:hypothetical protein